MKKLVSVLVIAFIICSSCASMTLAATDTQVWRNPSVNIFDFKKIILLPVNKELRAGSSLLPASELERELEDWGLTSVRNATKGKKIMIRPAYKVMQDLNLIYGEEDYSNQTELLGLRLRDMGYDAVMSIAVSQEFQDQYIPPRTFNYMTYQDSNIYNNQGWIVGRVSTPQNQSVTIPGREETYLHTMCTTHLYSLQNVINGHYSYDAVANSSIYKLYQGGDVIKVIEKIIKASMNSMYNGKVKK